MKYKSLAAAIFQLYIFMQRKALLGCSVIKRNYLRRTRFFSSLVSRSSLKLLSKSQGVWKQFKGSIEINMPTSLSGHRVTKPPNRVFSPSEERNIKVYDCCRFNCHQRQHETIHIGCNKRFTHFLGIGIQENFSIHVISFLIGYFPDWRMLFNFTEYIIRFYFILHRRNCCFYLNCIL